MRTAALTAAALGALAGVAAARLSDPARRTMVEQASRPRGRLAAATGRGLNWGNRRIHIAAIDAIDPRPGERLLDIGFGGGGLLERTLVDRPGVDLAGIDPSPEMVAALSQRRGHEISAGRLDLREGTAARLPWPDGAFDAVISVFTLYFWPDLDEGMAEVARVTAPGGRVAIVVAPVVVQRRVGFERAGFNILDGQRLEGLMRRAGLEGVELRRGPLGVTIALGWAPPDQSS